MSTPRTDVEEVVRANTAFYEAMERGDFEELSSLWLAPMDVEGAEHTAAPAETADTAVPSDTADPEEDTDKGAEVSCVHPGWPVLTGRGEVLRSYALIMANTEYIQFFLTDVHVSVISDTALVTCTENILSGGPAPEDSDELGPLVGQLVVATNVFRRTSDGWKLWSHHASPVLAESGEEESDETPS
ncbi:DUF4440 domain-containing protein [Streptomyces montanus]|uniref:DUF4440 domain-containing protein n=1 Tax=Streptomyces montanus TaxID=2580423 RepID=A0A5R9FIZ6_9ACTN|nr:nuclear transport factor 2 family protein [Streptomyces montanus]TLS42146.1 DUF4440 domain-containing protein [Streptomyces montanus]